MWSQVLLEQGFAPAAPARGVQLVAALRLPGHARATLAAELLQSLDQAEVDGDVDVDVEAAWADEIKRRLDEVDAGTVTPVPWPEARRRLLVAARGRGESR